MVTKRHKETTMPNITTDKPIKESDEGINRVIKLASLVPMLSAHYDPKEKEYTLLVIKRQPYSPLYYR